MEYLKFILSVFFILFFVNNIGIAGTGIKINELVSTNGDSYLDDNNDNPDWLELYNDSDVPVNLKGYRIFNKASFNSAYILPDTTIQPREYILLSCSEENRVGAGYYSIEAAGWGVVSYLDFDKFRFDYIEIEPGQDFDIQVNVRSFKSVHLSSKVGLMFREELTEGSKLVGEFACIPFRRLLSFAWRDEVNKPIIPHYSLSEPMEFPDYWLRLKKVGDTVSYYTIYNKYDWIKKLSYYFPNKDKKMYLGISTASADEFKNTKAYFADLRYNGKPYSFDSLKVYDCMLRIPSKRYEAKDIHTNFKLKEKGATVYLWDNQGNIIDTLTYGKLDPDVSYGRYPDGNDNLKYFLPSTPETKNVNPNEGRAATPTVTEDAGFYSNSVKLKIKSDDENSIIYYSLNACDPDTSNIKYNGEELIFTQNTILKAIAYKQNMIPSRILTKSYFINEENELPVVSLTSDTFNLYGAPDGILLEQIISQDIEVGGTVEFWNLKKNSYYQTEVGIKLHGNSARHLPQKSFKFYARDRYGVGDFEYPFWGDESLKKYTSFILRNASNDWGSAYLRDAFASVVARKNPHLIAAAYRPVVCYLNGQYYGFINLRERIEEKYLSEKFGIEKDSINLLEDDDVLVNGSVVPFKILTDSVLKYDMSAVDSYNFIDRNIDVDNLIDYNILEIYGNNADWPYKNKKYWNCSLLDNKWRWIVNDLDWTFGLPGNYPMQYTFRDIFVNQSEMRYSKFMNKLFENEIFKMKFIVRFSDLMNTEYKSDKFSFIIDSLASNIKNEIPKQQQRWDSCAYHWEEHIDIMKDFCSKRNEYVFIDIGRFFNIHQPDYITIDCNLPNAAKMNINTVSNISLPFVGKYFREYPLSVTLIPNDGYEFIGWSDSSLPKNLSVVVNFDTTLNLTALFKDTSPYVDGTGDIVKNDFSFYPNPASDKLSVSFLLKNSGTLDIFLMDMLGNKVAVLNEKIEYYGGRHNYIFDLSGINSGVYNICLKLYGKNTVNLNKKVVIIK